MDTQTIKDKLNCLYVDFHMLADGSWEPDDHSVSASIESLEIIVEELQSGGILSVNFEMEDFRDEDT